MLVAVLNVNNSVICFIGDTTLPADQSYTYLNVDDAKDLRYRKVIFSCVTSVTLVLDLSRVKHDQTFP